MNSTLSIHDLPEQPAAHVAALGVELLADLLEQAEAHMDRAKAIKASLDEAIAHRYGDHAALVRNQNNKPTGIVRFDDGPFVVITDLPKKPEWDQEKLAELVGKIRESGEDPADYVEIAYRVPESRYTAWPTFIKKFFEAARTLKVGKATFKLERSTGRGGR
ncbi:hypothetical protein SIID45300_02283 [Candidatus Magnetaquicoccaceae bacterium FCR-1]|uniref:Uncharacterized protein n=1 Tax=Candidatus Magnetaquiglobus chichijimensis TaxID=3141448 RepID=A0ABQ0CAN1_9PROT